MGGRYSNYSRCVSPRKCKMIIPTLLGICLVLGVDHINSDPPPGADYSDGAPVQDFVRGSDKVLADSDGLNGEGGNRVVGKAPRQCPPELKVGKDLPRTALVSYPGSGDNWLRHLLQVATGIYVSSPYSDGPMSHRRLSRHGYGSALVLSLHSHGPAMDMGFPRAILIYRRPHDAILSAYRRRMADYDGEVDRNSTKLDAKAIDGMLMSWRNTYRVWLTNYTSPLHVVHHHHLREDLVGEMTSVLKFLNWEVTAEQMQCVSRSDAGQFYRYRRGSTKDEDFYTPEALRYLGAMSREIELLFEFRKTQGLKLST